MGNVSSAEIIEKENQTEIIIKLADPEDLLPVCAGLEARQVNVRAVHSFDNHALIWCEKHPIVNSVDDNVLGFSTGPVLYQPKGSKRKSYKNLSHLELMNVVDELKRQGHQVSSYSPPTCFDQEKFIYLR